MSVKYRKIVNFIHLSQFCEKIRSELFNFGVFGNKIYILPDILLTFTNNVNFGPNFYINLFHHNIDI